MKDSVGGIIVSWCCFDRFHGNAGAWMISIARWLHKCKFKINSIRGMNFRLTVMNAFRNSVERQRPVKDIYFDLVKTKWDWMQSFVKPVISGGRLAVHPTNPPTFIEREKQIQFLIFQVFFHPQILCSLLWLQSTSTTEILTYKSNPHYEYCCYKYKVLFD